VHPHRHQVLTVTGPKAPRASRSARGSLTIVGTGIKAVSHITTEARLAIETTKKLFYLVADPVTIHWLKGLNPTAESLFGFYGKGKDRMVTYLEMVERVLEEVRGGHDVCVAFYGHPGVFAFPPHEAVRRARAEGFDARMLPGISSEDCLIAELGLDPGTFGSQSFEASDFLINRRRYDPTSLLLLWQIGVIGESALPIKSCDRQGLRALVERLNESYSGSHEVITYEAATHLIGASKVVRLPLERLSKARITAITTLCVPPKQQRRSDEKLYRKLFRVSA
jgi:precorrin-6B methylase 1